MKCAKCDEQTTGRSKYCREHRDAARAAWKQNIIDRENEKADKEKRFVELYNKACEAGVKAADECVPIPMVVEAHANMMDDNSPVVQSWHVPDGVCGFAWIVIRPGTCSFARWTVKYAGAKKHYHGGVSIWVSAYGQSMQRKEAYAYAFAKVLQDAGIKAYASSRMD